MPGEHRFGAGYGPGGAAGSAVGDQARDRVVRLGVVLAASGVALQWPPPARLLVDITHPKVQALYETWGYARVGEQQPFADSPVYAVMVKDLRD